MSADKVLKTQTKYSNVLTSRAGKVVDFFSQRPSDRVKAVKESAIRRRLVSANQNFNWGKTVQFRIPQVSYLGDMYLVLKIALPDKNLRAGWGASVIESFRLRNAGRLIQEHLNYSTVYKHFLDNLSPEKLNQVKKIQGQQGKSAQTVVIPIFTFWSSFCKQDLKRGFPLQYDKLASNEGLVVEFTVNPVGSVIESSETPTSPNALIQSVDLVFSEWLTVPSLEEAHQKESYVYHGHDYKMRTGLALPNNTSTSVDCTALTGHTKYYFIDNNLDTEGNQQDRTQNNELTEISVNIDGREYMSMKSKEEIRAESLLWGGKGSTENNRGSNYLMFSVSGCEIQSGGLNSQDVKDCKMTLKQENGGACTANILAVQDVIFTIENGTLRRQD